MPPRQHEPTPVMRSHMVAVGDVITAINGMPMLGFDTSVVATVLQDLPACVTLRLVKYGFDYIPAVAQTQVRMRRAAEGRGSCGFDTILAAFLLFFH